MNLRNIILAGLLLMGVLQVAENALAQLPNEATRIYTLIRGSELTDDCPICDRTPIVLPMTGTFRLQFLDQTPLFTRCQFYLRVVAVPALQFRAIIPDQHTGNISLQWDSNGGQAQLERAATVNGLYSPISPITTNLSFTDVGALTNGTQWFYRLRQY